MNKRDAKKHVLAKMVTLLCESYDPSPSRSDSFWFYEELGEGDPLSETDRFRLLEAANAVMVELAGRSNSFVPPELEHHSIDEDIL
jgi:hypothetical protein